jgi:ABC-2 type transport system permease protein
VVPGLLLITLALVVQGTAIMVAMDMTGGIIDRFRTMATARASVLTGHLLGSLLQTLVALAVLIGVAFGLGFHSSAGPLRWLAAIGILALSAFALIWLAVALGLAAKGVETASNSPMFLIMLPFLGSGFVPTATMPAGLRQFAEYQPFTPITGTVRGLLTGAAIGDNAIAAIAWSIGVAVVAYLWAIHLYNQRRAAEPKYVRRPASTGKPEARFAWLRGTDPITPSARSSPQRATQQPDSRRRPSARECFERWRSRACPRWLAGPSQ